MMKRMMVLGLLLKVTTSVYAATSSVVSPDYSDVFSTIKSQNAVFENVTDKPIQFTVLTDIVEPLASGERRVLSAEPGRSFIVKHPKTGATVLADKLSVSNRKKDSAYTTVRAQKLITLNPGEMYREETAWPSYVAGVLAEDAVQWSIGEDGLTVFMGETSDDVISQLGISMEPQDLAKQESLYKKYFMSGSTLTGMAVWADFLAQPSGVMAEKRLGKIIFTLTSYPKRMIFTWIAIESLLRQKVKPDHIVLNLYEGQFPGRVLPWFIIQQVKRGLEVNWCAVDDKVYLKLGPTTLIHPEAAVYVTVDDDVAYNNTDLGDVYEGSLRYPNCVITRDVRIPYIQGGVIFPVKYWEFTGYEVNNSRALEPGIWHMPESVTMTFIPKGALNNTFFMDKSRYSAVAPTDDDAWIFASLRGSGYKVAKVERTKERTNIETDNSEALYYQNAANDFEKLNRTFGLLIKQDFIPSEQKIYKLHPGLEPERTIEGQIQLNSIHTLLIDQIEGLEYIFNSTLYKISDQWVVASRTKITGEDFKRILLSVHDDQWSLLKYHFIVGEKVSYEDPRFSVLNGELYLSWVLYQNHWDFGTKVLISKMNAEFGITDIFRPSIGDNSKTGCYFEKNWLFYDHDGRTRVIYSICPLKVFEAFSVNDDFTEIISRSDSFAEWKYGIPRASIGPIPVNDHYMIFFHSHVEKAKARERVYFLGLALYDKDLNIVRYTKEPILESILQPAPANEAYCILPYGYHLEGDDISISCGLNDISTIVLNMSLSKLVDMIS